MAIRELGDIANCGTTRQKRQRNRITIAVQLDLHGIDGMLRMTVEDDGKLKGLFYPEVNAAKKDTLEDFFKWVSEACPSERYMVLFWGHSSGPVVLVGTTRLGSQARQRRLHSHRDRVQIRSQRHCKNSGSTAEAWCTA